MLSNETYALIDRCVSLTNRLKECDIFDEKMEIYHSILEFINNYDNIMSNDIKGNEEQLFDLLIEYLEELINIALRARDEKELDFDNRYFAALYAYDHIFEFFCKSLYFYTMDLVHEKEDTLPLKCLDHILEKVDIKYANYRTDSLVANYLDTLVLIIITNDDVYKKSVIGITNQMKFIKDNYGSGKQKERVDGFIYLLSKTLLNYIRDGVEEWDKLVVEDFSFNNLISIVNKADYKFNINIIV